MNRRPVLERERLIRVAIVAGYVAFFAVYAAYLSWLSKHFFWFDR